MSENEPVEKEIPLGHYYYFSYDTSMDSKWMDEYYVDYTDFQPAKLSKHEVRFNVAGHNNTALPNICRSEDDHKFVLGILYTLSSPRDGILKLEDSLKKLKGRVFIEDINVEILSDGKIKPAFIFVASMDEINDHLSRIEQTYFDDFFRASRHLLCEGSEDYVKEMRVMLKRKFVLIQYKPVKSGVKPNSRIPPEHAGSRPKYLKSGFFKFF